MPQGLLFDILSHAYTACISTSLGLGWFATAHLTSHDKVFTGHSATARKLHEPQTAIASSTNLQSSNFNLELPTSQNHQTVTDWQSNVMSAVTCCRQHPLRPLKLLIQCRPFSTTPTHFVTPRKVPKPTLLPGAAGVTETSSLPLLHNSPVAALHRRRDPFRTGVIARKKGMTALFDAKGTRTACTILQLDRCQVMTNKTRQDHGYWAVQVGAGERNPKNVTKPMLGHFAKCETSPKQVIKEFRIRDERGLMKPGTLINANWFRKGQLVDLRAKNKGKGFAGGMKRHGFSGQPASHGNSLMHRAMGSAGQSQGGGSRVLPGKRMAGRMGGEHVTIQLAKILDVNNQLNTVVVKGCVPGPIDGIVTIQDARLSHPPSISTSYRKSMISPSKKTPPPTEGKTEVLVAAA
ncbi:54S ribosomal protein L9, mitochondrial [Orbilia oligospora]|uniref:Large ribosomal subunit protein uL3m n=2 Tax=Orbilia oligospora TaxID=2813651 RepID=A0A7C8NIJ0_ORBOL|nr:54S ribosomal protein L9, mitochondrial [Orbilia oligospora]KAF3131101.1 54S ribosomal protein L9, mitochondrial [Orbilia oligospora]